MHVTIIGVLTTLAALGAAAPHGGRQETLSTQAISLQGCTGSCFQLPFPCADGQKSIQVGAFCWKCCTSDTLISQDVQEKPLFSPARPLVEQSATKTNDQGICWRACFPEEVKCPEEWESKRMGGGDCWTCCLKEQEEAVEQSTAKTIQSIPISCDRPLRPLTPWEPDCPSGTHVAGRPFAYTCCEDEPETVAAGPPCIPMCFDAPPKQCLYGSHPQQLGQNCWTCCGGSIGSLSTTAIVLDEIKAKAVSKTFSPTEPACVPVCYPAGQPLRCLFGYQPRFIDGCLTCCNPDQRAISGPDDFKVSVKSMAISKSLAVEGPPCVPVCHVAQPRCAFGYHPAMIEPGCWSCCMRLDLENAASASMDLVMSDPEICWRACFPEKIQCPPNGHAKNFGGDCWTCCFGGDESIQKNTQSLITQLDTSSNGQSLTDDPCLMICLQEKPEKCGTNGYAKQFGSCWTCCLKTDAENHQTISSDSFKTYSLISHNPSKQMMVSHRDICLKMCMFEEPKCGQDMYPKQFGDCWTCCFKSQDSEAEQSKLITDVATYPPFCLKVCFPSADSCPKDFFPDPKSGNGCTVCCLKETQEASQTVVPAKQTKHNPSLANVGQVCLKACFPSKDSCPENFFPDPNYDGGSCTICCTKYGEDARLTVAEL